MKKVTVALSASSTPYEVTSYGKNDVKLDSSPVETLAAAKVLAYKMLAKSGVKLVVVDEEGRGPITGWMAKFGKFWELRVVNIK